MKEKEHVEKAHQLADEWFVDHVAKMTMTRFDHDGQVIIMIDWKRPDTYNYSVRYLIDGGMIIVTGDLGDAIYGFGQRLTFDKILQLDWHYFIHKCCASETGRNYEMKVTGIKHPVPNVRAIAHYVGLRKAIEQLINV